MAEFNKAFEPVLGHEGGYVNDVSDRGGETYKGIARKFWPDWEGWSIIREAKDKPNFPGNLDSNVELDNFVRQFYKREFWDLPRFGLIDDQNIANELFDTAVNQGRKTASKYLQEALNLLNRNQRDYKDMAVDGKIGPVTAGTTNNHKRPYNILKTLNGLQFMRYYKLATNDPVQEKFFNGWLNRVE